MAITTIYESRVKIPEDVFYEYAFAPMDKEYERLSIGASKDAFESETDSYNQEEVARFYNKKDAEEFEKKIQSVFEEFKNKNRKALGL